MTGLVQSFMFLTTAFVVAMQILLIDGNNLAPIDDQGGKIKQKDEKTVDIYSQTVSNQMIFLYIIMSIIQSVITIYVTINTSRNNIQQLRELKYDKHELRVSK